MANLQTVGGTAGKETIYVDVDDEITAIIDKVSDAKGKIVALVLPKRCPVLQSVVNMKLLKRTADNAKKNLVLITSEAGLMPLAGSVGLYVAGSPSSRPAIPEVAGRPPDDGPETLDEPLKVVDGNEPDAGGDFDAKAASDRSIGELASTAAVVDDGTIDLSNDDPDVPLPAAGKGKAKALRPKKDKKLKVPNFDSFRKKLALGGLALVAVIVALYFALSVLPSAVITISTDSSTIPTNLNLTLDTSATKLDQTDNIVPATAQSQQKTATQTVPATGQQNNGTKASGTITITNCSGSPVTIQAGSSFSASGHVFIAQSATTIPDSNYTHSGDCKNDGKGSVPVTALKGGADYNLGVASYSFSGGSSSLTAQGSAMSGGTDNILTVVQQSDIDNATSKIASADADSIKQQLQTNLESKGLQPVAATFLAGDPQVTASAKPGDQASNVTVTSVTTYTMLGVKKSDLQTLVHSNVDKQLDKGKQVVLDDGIGSAQFTENTPGTAANATVSMSAKSQAGPDLKVDDLKKQLAGMKSGDVKNAVKQTPGVTDVQVKYSPFWVNSVPKKAAKVQITIVKDS